MWQRPSIHTKFNIDYDWWTENGKDVRVAVRGQLCPDCQSRFPDHRNTEAVDWVDPDTAEVVRGDALLQCLRSECALKPGFIGRENPVVTNIFRIFLLNGNQPLTPEDLQGQMPWTDASAILRTITAGSVYFGIRPTSKTD